ncbi:MAG: DUF262 domain-containing protein [Sulfurovum sp.]|nr:DUF262 domain-containing protein [Sulfurovum sp.]
MNSTLSEFKDYPIKDFLTWNEQGGLNISPKFQRNSVWNTQAKSYLIDTILRGLPIPPIFLKEYIDRETKETIREVIDGQQRLTAIITFYQNHYKIMKNHNKEFGNLTYEELDDDTQINFLGFNIPIVLVKTENDSIVYDMFARLNTNNMILNRQEIRNAKYWGEFKIFANKIATKYRNFFINSKTFSDKQIIRMVDIELINSFIVVILDGIIAETPTKIDTYYSKYDKTFDEIDEVESKLYLILSIIEQLFEIPTYSINFFHTKVSIYTLFTALYYLIYGEGDFQEFNILNENEIIDSDGNIKQEIIKKIIIRLENFESTIMRTKEGELEGEEYKKYKLFLDYHRTRTTSKKREQVE